MTASKMRANRLSVDYLGTICRHEFLQSNSLGFLLSYFLLADFLSNLSEDIFLESGGKFAGTCRPRYFTWSCKKRTQKIPSIVKCFLNINIYVSFSIIGQSPFT